MNGVRGTHNSTLASEGILPTKHYNPIASAAHTIASSSSYASLRQLHQGISASSTGLNSSFSDGSGTGARWAELFLLLDHWINLEEGWFQATPPSSGTSTRCGLHSVVESPMGQLYMCIYEPRTREALKACTSISPLYDLEISSKIIKAALLAPRTKPTALSAAASATKTSLYMFHLVFAFKTIHDFAIVGCDAAQARWTIAKVTNGQEVVVAEARLAEIKANQFHTILLQVRENRVSVDVNGSPIFTSVRFPDGSTLNGLLGLQSIGSKFAVKGWKLRGVDFSALGANDANVTAATTRPQLGNNSNIDSKPVAFAMPLGTANTRGGLMSLADLMTAPVVSGSDNDNGEYDYYKSSPSAVSRALEEEFENGNHGNSNFNYNDSITADDLDDSVPENVFKRSYAPLPVPYSHQEHLRTMQRPTATAVLPPAIYQTTRLGAEPVPWGGGGGPGAPSATYRGAAVPVPGGIALPSAVHGNSTADNQSASLIAQLLEQRLAAAMELMLATHSRSIVDTVFRDVVQTQLGVTFDDIAALETAKRLLNEAVVLPLIMPEFFTGIREPWKGVLLFGPPGTGKTLLAKAVCSMNASVFFNCPSSSLVSKYRGDSEKIIRCLFEAARLCAPSIIFLDEIDALVSSRGMDNEHEASRRMKTELFAQMDGVSSGPQQGRTGGNSSNSNGGSGSNGVGSGGVMVLATTNCPWDIDEALRRRLEKRIYIPLPDLAARSDLFRICLRDIPISPDVDPRYLAMLSDGFSGADVHIVCREASMMPLRRIMSAISPMELHQQRLMGTLAIPKVLLDDFRNAIKNTRPSVSHQSIARYVAWDEDYGNK